MFLQGLYGISQNILYNKTLNTHLNTIPDISTSLFELSQVFNSSITGVQSLNDRTQLNLVGVISGIPTPGPQSIQYLEKLFDTVGTCEENRKKIPVLLYLMENCYLYTHLDSLKETQETYFYRAVSLLGQYGGEYPSEEVEGKAILIAYYVNILGQIMKPTAIAFSENPLLRKLIYPAIEQENTKRKGDLHKKAKKTDTYLEGVRDHNDIIRKIEAIFGPIRLLIISEESGEPITIHRVDAKKIKSIRKSAREYEYTLKVDILDQERKYRVIIDYGSAESQNRPDEDHIKDIINPILVRHIEQKENAFISYARDYRKFTREAEKTMRMVKAPNDYGRFVEMVLSDTGNTSISADVRDNPEYAAECHQALELSGILTISHATGDNDRDRIVASMDTILGGRITRNVLDMIRAILISRTEMMSGSGCPFGLSKEDIPLEARIHTIIRAYQAICHKVQDPEKMRTLLIEWNQGGYFDARIFSIFMKFLDTGGPASSGGEGYADMGSIPNDRKRYYIDFLEAYDEQRALVEKIEQAYMSFHGASDIIPERSRLKKIEQAYISSHDASDIIPERSRLAIIINDLQYQLVNKINFTKIFGVTVHGQSPRDKKVGQPGGPHGGLTQIGKGTSISKGKRLPIYMRLFASPFLRALHTARIMRRVLKDVHGIIIKITLVDGLQNPPKDLPNIRPRALITKFAKDHPVGISDFLRRIIHSTIESVNVIVAHGTTSSYLLGIIDNYHLEKSANMRTIDMEEDDIVVRLVRGGRRVEWDLVFPFEGWEDVLAEVDKICESTFGEKFSRAEMKGIQHIKLHKKFLDYMDRKMQESPEKVVKFLKGLDEGKHTQNFRSMLRKSDLANKKLL